MYPPFAEWIHCKIPKSLLTESANGKRRSSNKEVLEKEHWGSDNDDVHTMSADTLSLNIQGTAVYEVGIVKSFSVEDVGFETTNSLQKSEKNYTFS